MAAAPLCTRLVATYTPVPKTKYHSVTSSPMFQSAKRQNRGLTPKKLLLISCNGVTQEKSQGKRRRVVVTGIGLITPPGDDPDIFYNNVLQGISGISNIENSDTFHLPTKIGGEITSFSTDGYVASKIAKRADRNMLYLLIAGKKALADAGITDEVNKELNKTRCGIMIGTALGGSRGFRTDYLRMALYYEQNIKDAKSFLYTNGSLNMGSALLATDLGWMGLNYGIGAEGSTSNNCIMSAAGHIIDRETDMKLCGGADSGLHPLFLGGVAAMRCLSQRKCDPKKASMPLGHHVILSLAFDQDRDGIVIGEGAGVFLLEELEHAKQRGARVYAEFLGGSFSADAYHITQPHPDGKGMILCLEKALANAGVAREDVNYINAHAVSTQTGDLMEFRALPHCFGNNPEIRINPTKSLIGHLHGAAGAVDAIVAVKAIQKGWIHPNINLDNPDKGVDMNLLVGPKKEQLEVKLALSGSFGLGGQNSCILFTPVKVNREQDSQQRQ